jgi:hypothetical protein
VVDKYYALPTAQYGAPDIACFVVGKDGLSIISVDPLVTLSLPERSAKRRQQKQRRRTNQNARPFLAAVNSLVLAAFFAFG